MKKNAYSMALLLLLPFVLAINTAAYLDPGAFTYMIQAVAGVIIVAGATIGIFWKRIRLFFKKRKQAKRFAAMEQENPETTAPAISDASSEKEA